MNFQIALGFLSLYILALTASRELKCVTNKYVGGSYTITLNSPQQNGDLLVWKCNDKIIYKRRRGKVDPAANVDDLGSLTLTNISKSMACTYKAEHHDRDGRLLKEYSESLCVFSRIPDPKLEVECSPSGVATLQCGPKNLPEGITLAWFQNKKEMKMKSNPLTLQKRGRKDLYKCRLSNGLDSGRESKEEMLCEVSGGVSNNNLLFGYNKWVMIGIITGGGFLLLVLIISLIAICCKNHRRRKMRQRDNEEPRLCYRKDTSTDPRQLKQAAF
ncbi:T-cell surface antigen CD2-like [Sardina pilchardus]|uniref:T-cell surface antigen CD2-like n=1 Tax=Sardina pilchardus TaxID=27697 RepID=UPI002E0FDA0C